MVGVFAEKIVNRLWVVIVRTQTEIRRNMVAKISMEERTHKAWIALKNAKDNPEIVTRMEVFNYGVPKLDIGLDLHRVAEELIADQLAKYGDQHDATKTVKDLWTSANIVYKQTFKVAKIGFRQNPGAHTSLKLHGKRKYSLSGWLDQSTIFYTNLLGNETLLARMAEFGYDRDKLEAEFELVKAVRAADRAQEEEKGEAQNATKERDAKLDELDQWISDFKAIAKIAMADKPQLLEKLGFGAVK